MQEARTEGVPSHQPICGIFGDSVLSRKLVINYGKLIATAFSTGKLAGEFSQSLTASLVV